MESPKGRILYTDDDPEARELLRFFFTHCGYEIVCAESGVDALHLATVERFDLILVDNWMPTLTGIDLTQYIRQFNQDTPILFCSGAAHESDRQAALTAGAQGYFIKPLDIELLLVEVERLIRRNEPV